MTVKPARCARARQAYTLLEVLIAGVLVTVLMVAVWSMLRTWSNMYEKGQSRTQLAQLVRSLSDQWTEDIQSVVVPARPRSSRSRSPSNVLAPAVPTQESTSEPDSEIAEESDPMALESEASSFEVREVALVGGKDWLVLDVVRTPSPWLQSEVDSETETPTEMGPQVYVPDLQRVIYTFVGKDDSQDSIEGSEVGEFLNTGETTPGLLRLAMAREFVGEMEDQEELGGGLSRGTSLRTRIFEFRDRILMGGSYDLSSAITEEEPTVDEAFVIPETDNSPDQRDGLEGVLEQDFVPEVRWLEFRYFSGSSWSDSWDSSGGKGLPVAVEIRFELEELQPIEAIDEAGDEDLTTLDDQELLADEEVTTESFEDEESLYTDEALLDETQTEETPYHRCIVVLGLAEPPKAASPTDLMGDVLP